MLELFFFLLGLVNSILLICIFLMRKNRLTLLRRIGWTYLLLSIPAGYGLVLVAHEQKTVQYSIFLVIFLIYLTMEWLYDYVFKIPFRETRSWRLLVPYLALYYAMNYGFVVMPWKTSLTWGIIMLGLFVVQIITNLGTHPLKTRKGHPKQRVVK